MNTFYEVKIMNKKIIGIDLGGTSIKFAILTQNGEIQEKWSIPTTILDEGSHIVPDIIQSIKHKLTLLGLTKDDFLGIGMGSPGVVNRQEGTVIGAYNLNWKTLQPIKEQIEFSGAGGELGHIAVDFEDPIACTCGKKGCLETVASATGIVNLTRRYAEQYAGDSELKARIDDGQQVTAKDVFDLAKEQDRLALIVIRHFSEYLGVACSHIANILNPSRIVIGGGVSAAGEFLLKGVREEFEKNVFPPIKDSTVLALAELGNDAGVIGAASLVLIGKS